MDLTLFFSPVPESIYSSSYHNDTFLKNIKIFEETIPNYQDAHIAIIGLNEMSGAGHHTGQSHAPNEIRKKMYALKRGSGAYRIIDLGNLNLGINLDETILRLSEVCKFLLENNVLPIILGGSQDLDYGQFCAYENLDKLISLVNVDAFLDFEDNHKASADQKHIHKILLHHPNYLLSYSHLAYQSFLIDQTHINILQKLYFEAFRIGEIRTKMHEIEPTIRIADMLTFDICSIRSSDAPGNDRPQPFGLTAEDACQICWYAGINEKLSSIGFYGYTPDFDDIPKKTASVIATMVWYFIEGFYHRKKEVDFRSNDFTKFIVIIDPETITFYKSKFTERWWMEVPIQNKQTYARNRIVPCSYNDYQVATNGNLPERYIKGIGNG